MKPSTTGNITFAVAVNNREVFENNFLASPCLRGPCNHQILVQKNFNSAAKAYNDAIEKSSNDLIVFCHQDIYLPEAWPSDLSRALGHLELHDPNWGVLGCSGMTVNGRHWRYLYSSGLAISGEPFTHPQPVQTLDEIVLILRKSSGLRFDEELPHFHMYGTDICLRASQRGMKNYTISAFYIHNTHQALVLPEEFYVCCKHVKRVWRDYLPIQTTCVRVTRFNLPLYRRRLGEFYLRHIRRKVLGGTRAPNPQRLLEELAAIATNPQS